MSVSGWTRDWCEANGYRLDDAVAEAAINPPAAIASLERHLDRDRIHDLLAPLPASELNFEAAMDDEYGSMIRRYPWWMAKGAYERRSEEWRERQRAYQRVYESRHRGRRKTRS